MKDHRRARQVVRGLIERIRAGQTAFSQGGVELAQVALCDGTCDAPEECRRLFEELLAAAEERARLLRPGSLARWRGASVVVLRAYSLPEAAGMAGDEGEPLLVDVYRVDDGREFQGVPVDELSPIQDHETVD